MPAENDPFRYIPESGAGSDDVTESTDPPDRSETESEVDEGVGELATEETVEIPQASDMDDSVDSQNEKNEKVSYFYNGFWHSTESTHPVEVLGPPFEGDDGKQYVEVKWFNNDGKETGKAYASVDDVVKGKQVVRIKRTSGEIEDGWFVDEIFVETESARVRKNSPDGESIVKDISWEDLWSWQQPEDKPWGGRT